MLIQKCICRDIWGSSGTTITFDLSNTFLRVHLCLYTSTNISFCRLVVSPHSLRWNPLTNLASKYNNPLHRVLYFKLGKLGPASWSVTVTYELNIISMFSIQCQWQDRFCAAIMSSGLDWRILRIAPLSGEKYENHSPRKGCRESRQWRH